MSISSLTPTKRFTEYTAEDLCPRTIERVMVSACLRRNQDAINAAILDLIGLPGGSVILDIRVRDASPESFDVEMRDSDGNSVMCRFTSKSFLDGWLIGECDVSTRMQTAYVRGILDHSEIFGTPDDPAVLGMAHHNHSNVAALTIENEEVIIRVIGYLPQDNEDDDIVQDELIRQLVT